MRQGNLADARKYVSRALKLDPKNERLYRSLALLETQSGHQTEAILCLRRGIAELPESGMLHVHLADVLLDQGKSEEARRQLDKAGNQAGAVGAVAYLEGRLLMLDRQWPEAIDRFVSARAALGSGSEWTSSICTNLGSCYQRLGEVDQQLLAYRDAVLANSSNVPARLGLSKAMLAAHWPDAACAELRGLAALPQAPAETWVLLARALLDSYQRKMPAEAQWKELDAALAKAAADSPDNPALVVLDAERWLLKGNPEQAEAQLQLAVIQRPKEPGLWTALADIQTRRDKFAQALATLKTARAARNAPGDISGSGPALDHARRTGGSCQVRPDRQAGSRVAARRVRLAAARFGPSAAAGGRQGRG